MSTHRRKDTRAHKWAIRTAMVLGTVLMVACVVIIYWLVKPYSYVEATQPKVVDGPFKPGGPAYLQYESFCINEPVAITVQRSSINQTTGRILHFLSYEFPADSVQVKCFEDLITTPVPLPPELLPGKYQLEVKITYKPNPVRSVTETFTSDVFEVIEPDLTLSQYIANP